MSEKNFQNQKVKKSKVPILGKSFDLSLQKSAFRPFYTNYLEN
jgi:hypothetical protein